MTRFHVHRPCYHMLHFVLVINFSFLWGAGLLIGLVLILVHVWSILQGDADSAIDRLWQKKRAEIRQ